MKIAIITTDNRWLHGEQHKESPWFGMAPEALLAGFAGLPDAVEVHVISCTRLQVKSPEKLGNNVWFHSLYVPKIGWMRTGYQGCIRAVRRKMREIQPDLVHGHGTEYECSISAVLSGYPNVVTLLGIMKEMAQVMKARPGSFHWIAAVLESMTLRRTTGVLANSRFTEAKVRNRTSKTWLVPNAVREVFFTDLPGVTPDQRLLGQPPVLLNVGVVCANKRQNELLDIADQLHEEGLEFRLEFLGPSDPAKNPYAARFLERLETSTYASYHGFKPVAGILEHYHRAAALVHVSKIESFGLVVAEALSRNLKFIGFNAGGVADIISGVEGAEGFADGDWPGVKAALRRWIKAGAPRLVTAAQTMKERYHPLVIARRHLEIYREVLRRP